jgi:hypothetical protein
MYINSSINQLSSLQINECEPNLRELYSKLILWLIYAKDLTLNLNEIKNLNEYSYEWLRVLKYKYEKRVAIKANDEPDARKNVLVTNKYDDFHVIQMTSRILYDFEYNGNTSFKLMINLGNKFIQKSLEILDLSSQLAITPLSERCFLSFTTSLNAFRCVGVIGPHLSGKRETINLLAQACGQHLKEINCNKNLTVELANVYMKGLVSSGSWVLFDKIDQLEISKDFNTKNFLSLIFLCFLLKIIAVLSSIGHHLDFIRSSIQPLLMKGRNNLAARNKLVEERVRHIQQTHLS